VLTGPKAGEDVGGLRLPDADQFPASGFTAENGQARLRKTQAVGQEGATGSVGRPSDRGRGEAQGDAIWQLRRELILRRARLDMHRYEDVRTVLLDDGRYGSHLGVAGLSGMAASRRS